MKCPECGVENISDTASKCPHCGYNLSAHRRNQHRIHKRRQFQYFLNRKSTKVVAVICIVCLLCGVFFFLKQKALYREFSGEYSGRTGLDGIAGLPNVIHFDEDGTGYYYENMHMYIFDYTLTSTSVIIDTHEEFMPIYKAELDVECLRTDDSFFVGNIRYDKRK